MWRDDGQCAVVPSYNSPLFQQTYRARDGLTGASDRQSEAGKDWWRRYCHVRGGAGLAQQFSADTALYGERCPFRQPTLGSFQPRDENARHGKGHTGISAHQSKKIRVAECTNVRQAHSDDLMRRGCFAKQAALTEQVAIAIVFDHAHASIMGESHHPGMAFHHKINIRCCSFGMDNRGVRLVSTDSCLAEDDVGKVTSTGKRLRDYGPALRRLIELLHCAVMPHLPGNSGQTSLRQRGRQACEALAAMLVFCGASFSAAQAGDGDVRIKAVPQSRPQGGLTVRGWSPDDRFVFEASFEGNRLVMWDAQTGALVNQIGMPPPPDLVTWVNFTSLAISPDGLHVVIKANALSGRGDLRLQYDVDMAKWTATVKPISGPPVHLPGGAPVYEPRAHFSPRWLNDNGPLHIADMQAHQGPGRGVRLASAPRMRLLSASIAPNGRSVALLDDERQVDDEIVKQAEQGIITRFDIETQIFAAPIKVPGDYNTVVWIDDSRLLVTQQTIWPNREVSPQPENLGDPADNPPALVLDATTGARLGAPVPARCFVASLGGDALIGAGLDNCIMQQTSHHGLERYTPDAGWRAFGDDVLAGRFIDTIAVAPDRSRIAVAAVSPERDPVVLLFDSASGGLLAELAMPRVTFGAQVEFAGDPDRLVILLDDRLYRWELGSGPPVLIVPPGTIPAQSEPHLLAVSSTTVYRTGQVDSRIQRFDLVTGIAGTDISSDEAMAIGLVPGKALIWAASNNDGFKLWTTDGAQVLTEYLFPGNRFLAVAPDGRYDTNLGPDTAEFRWLVSDAPQVSLPPQTFMRNYYEPRLAARRISCTLRQTCPTVFAPITGVAQLNRVLPQPPILSVIRGIANGMVRIEARVAPVIVGPVSSGIFDLRLFLDGRLIGTAPARDDPASASLADWRAANQLTPGPDGFYHARFDIALPNQPHKRHRLSAYVFNADRVKSDTVVVRVPTVAVPARTRHAYVIAVGIDDYDEAHFRLNFAVSDARLLSLRLATLPGFSVGQLLLAGAAGANGDRVRVTRRVLERTFGLLAGQDVLAARAEIAALGFDASALAPVTPDDILIITWSGHGWTSDDSRFFLVPSEGNWPDTAALPDTNTLISADDLTRWLTPINAREIAMVVDACHSAASVETPGFKPGPMGDRGLGQLAYDKGIRILAASQASDVALEDARLKQGLLTYTLAKLGISDSGGAADLDHNGHITLDEWLRYAVSALPILSEQVARGHVPAGAVVTRSMFIGSAPPPLRPQVPSLFDFNADPSGIVLRDLVP
jgi:hypothetical protein